MTRENILPQTDLTDLCRCLFKERRSRIGCNPLLFFGGWWSTGCITDHSFHQKGGNLGPKHRSVLLPIGSKMDVPKPGRVPGELDRIARRIVLCSQRGARGVICFVEPAGEVVWLAVLLLHHRTSPGEERVSLWCDVGAPYTVTWKEDRAVRSRDRGSSFNENVGTGPERHWGGGEAGPQKALGGWGRYHPHLTD